MFCTGAYLWGDGEGGHQETQGHENPEKDFIPDNPEHHYEVDDLRCYLLRVTSPPDFYSWLLFF